MKRLAVIFGLMVMLIAATAFNVAATPITGAISFSGTSAFDNTDLNAATKFTSFTGVTVSGTGGTGDYASLIGGTSITFQAFTFRPALDPSPLIPLWTVTLGSTTYSFDATGLVITFSNQGGIFLEGPGIAYINAATKEPTPGTWSITANTAGTTASFSSSTAVPEPSVMLLLGVGLVGLWGFRKKFKK